MNVLFVTSEAWPFVKTGGLADVSGALPACLRELGHDVRLLLPGYPEVLDRLPGASEAAPLHGLPGQNEPARLLLGEAPSGVPVYVLDAPWLFRRPGNPYLGPDGRDWADNHRRFAALGGVAAGFRPIWRTDIVHVHDWQGGLAPAYVAWGAAPRPKTVITVHNIAFQGVFPASVFGELGLPVESFSIDGVEYWGQVSYLKAGLFYADAITTVSPTYAREIQTPDMGFGMDGLLRARADRITGILNGIDTGLWNPAADAALPMRYDAGSLQAKAANKAALQRELGLEPAPHRPLFVVVTRLAWQKGLDLVLGALPALLREGGQLAVLGAGEPDLEHAFRQAEAAAPGHVAVRFGYDEDLSHRLQGGGDAILVPSRFEPCGLTQMYGLRYGTLPVVRRTGGLADTVEDDATGFVFDAATPEALAGATARACRRFAEPERWRRIQRAGMAKDFSWRASAGRYAALFAALGA